MPRPARLRASDLRAVYVLVGECRELGDDPAVWRLHLFAGLSRLAGAELVCGAELAGVRAGGPVPLGVADWGWERGFDRTAWDRAQAEMRRDPSLSRTPAVAAYLGRLVRDDGTALARTDLVPDRVWERCWDREHLHRAAGVDHAVWCCRSVPGTADEWNFGVLARPVGSRDFTARQKAVVRLGFAEVGGLVGGPLARFAEPAPSALPPRTRQVLRCLLEGDADKQVADRLGMARQTVNQHTKVIYRHFGVATRAELLARWVRRGWPVGGWAADPG